MQRPAVTRCGLPPPAAGRHGSHSPRPAVTRRSPPQSARLRHSPRPVSLGWRRAPPLLATARLTDSVTSRRRCAKAKAYIVSVARIWTTLIAIFIYEFIYKNSLTGHFLVHPKSYVFFMNSYMNSMYEFCARTLLGTTEFMVFHEFMPEIMDSGLLS